MSQVHILTWSPYMYLQKLLLLGVISGNMLMDVGNVSDTKQYQKRKDTTLEQQKNVLINFLCLVVRPLGLLIFICSVMYIILMTLLLRYRYQYQCNAYAQLFMVSEFRISVVYKIW